MRYAASCRSLRWDRPVLTLQYRLAVVAAGVVVTKELFGLILSTALGFVGTVLIVAQFCYDHFNYDHLCAARVLAGQLV